MSKNGHSDYALEPDSAIAADLKAAISREWAPDEDST